MIVRIDCNGKEHSNFYEGNRVGFRPRQEGGAKGLIVVIEGRNGKDCVTVEVNEGTDTQVYLMNDQGKTVEKVFV